MISTVYLGSTIVTRVTLNSSLKRIKDQIHNEAGIPPEDYYVLVNGRRVGEDDLIPRGCGPLNLVLRQKGGKGGFGSMLRAIGAQIEKTTNREACRDLSGRRLRDINEEKRLKAWLEKQKDTEADKKEKKKQKLERLLQEPKFEFNDKEYEKARNEMTEKIDDAVEKGFEKAVELAGSSGAAKRKATETQTAAAKAKKKKTTLWIADDLSSSSDTDSEDESNASSKDESSQSCCSSVIDK
ncbi:splicing regulator SDE2-like isoform X1 [Phlebotomus argentipes]|uniref:splicing regulator SDE2-like isoform X1 n=1 Tax=Phlebotomus argentipes TaxID=94469 RepID=UPI002892B14B|nr:splicing regulator SDE2-like isoform X1 [Phlebotomus argentipes]XP_059613747.1 splicing regulator SDE2-like isoform X1 [Phlebotomus argentipes]XP_059613756.1 splicing regulator SDE2-like isoform X1 [Phlebotomus argentipes]XP_059613764.1 splicing regulator SDE2-like isoform X1 [Phlebotomus argentipes]